MPFLKNPQAVDACSIIGYQWGLKSREKYVIVYVTKSKRQTLQKHGAQSHGSDATSSRNDCQAAEELIGRFFTETGLTRGSSVGVFKYNNG